MQAALHGNGMSWLCLLVPLWAGFDPFDLALPNLSAPTAPLVSLSNLVCSLTFPLLLPACPLLLPQVYYNGQRLKVKTFQEYVELYLGPKDGGVPRVYERFSDRWEVVVATTEGQFNQVSAWAAVGAQKLGGTGSNHMRAWSELCRGQGFVSCVP